LCATRGGEASWRTQDKAINLAKERGDELIFLYVADMSFLDKIAAPVVIDAGSGVERMGGFLLAMAQERAREKGLEVRVVIREGKTREEIKAAAKELGVNTVVLGLPVEGGVFQEEAIRAFAREIEEETGAEVVLV
ncbi:MAG: universal stress protein, partial [Anaerolineae bacterium]